jgi:hypothetical protein
LICGICSTIHFPSHAARGSGHDAVPILQLFRRQSVDLRRRPMAVQR